MGVLVGGEREGEEVGCVRKVEGEGPEVEEEEGGRGGDLRG